MAIKIPEGLYSGFSEVLDSSPTAKLMAKKQAQMEALDKYDKKRILDINSKGVRNIDREGFDKRLADIQRQFGANHAKIRKGNTPEAYQYEQSFRDIDAYINDSKERTAKQDAAMKLHTDVFKRNGIVPDAEDGSTFIDDVGGNDKALDDKSGKSFDLTKWMDIAAKPFSLEEQNKGYKDIPRTPGEAKYTPIPGDNSRRTETIEERFDDNAKNTIKERAAVDYRSKLNFKRQVDNEFATNRVQLAETYKKEFGKEPEKMEDYAAAFQLSIMNPVITKSKPVDNWQGKTDYQDKLSKNRIILNASLQGKGGGTYKVEDLVLPDGNTDLTKPLQGINVNNTVTGKAFKSDNTKYNPITKEITYHDVVDDKDYTVPASKYRQIINTVNTVQDLKVYDNLIQGIDKAFEKPKGKTTGNHKKVTVKGL